MRSIIGSLNMFLLDYLIVPIWAVFSIMGNVNSARIMIPVTIIFVIINYFNTRNSTRLFLLDINLAGASIAGIILNTFLYIRFVYADPQIITNMVTIIFLYTMGVIFACIISLVVKVIVHWRNMRIISRMTSGDYYADDADDDDDYEEDEDEDDEDDEEDEDSRSFLSSVSGFLRRNDDGDGNDDEDDEDDGDDGNDGDDSGKGYEKPDGPKFRVIKK